MRNKAKMAILAVLAVLTCVITFKIIETSGMAWGVDMGIQKVCFALRGSALDKVMIIITHMSDTWFIVGLCLILLLLPNRKKYGIPVTAASLMGVIIYKPLKHLVMRDRPDKIYHLVNQGGYSFPSGHSVTSVIVYGFLILLIERNVKNKKTRRALQGICLFLAIVIGPSRIYVGVHWPTDVICGWAIGLFVLILCSQLIEIYFHKISG